MPLALFEAQLIDGLCQRWHQLPSAIRRENAHDVLMMLALVKEATPEAED